MFVQQGQGGRTEHDLVVRIEAMPGQDRWRYFGVQARQDDGDGLVVDLGVGVVDAGPCGDIGVVVEQRQGLRRDIVARVERVVPVPPVERGM